MPFQGISIDLAYVARQTNWLTVQDNIQFVLEAQNIPRSRWQELVAKHLDIFGVPEAKV